MCFWEMYTFHLLCERCQSPFTCRTPNRSQTHRRRLVKRGEGTKLYKVISGWHQASGPFGRAAPGPERAKPGCDSCRMVSPPLVERLCFYSVGFRVGRVPKTTPAAS